MSALLAGTMQESLSQLNGYRQNVKSTKINSLKFHVSPSRTTSSPPPYPGSTQVRKALIDTSMNHITKYIPLSISSEISLLLFLSYREINIYQLQVIYSSN